MFGKNETSDAALLKAVNQRLQRGGAGSQARISANVQSGTVTISGNLQYDAQRAPLVKLVARIPGVRRVIDQLKLVPKAKSYGDNQRVATTAPAAAVEQPPKPLTDDMPADDIPLDDTTLDEAPEAGGQLPEPSP
jgi:hypothetical protein